MSARRRRRKSGTSVNPMQHPVNTIGCEGEDVVVFEAKLYKVEQITTAIEQQISAIAGQVNAILQKSPGITIPAKAFVEGYDCELLGAYSEGWKQGKFRVKFELEFIPECAEEIAKSDAFSQADISLESLRVVVDSE